MDVLYIALALIGVSYLCSKPSETFLQPTQHETKQGEQYYKQSAPKDVVYLENFFENEPEPDFHNPLNLKYIRLSDEQESNALKNTYGPRPWYDNIQYDPNGGAAFLIQDQDLTKK